jgi:hypothetical protein
LYRLQHSDDLKVWADVDNNGAVSQSSMTVISSGAKDFFRVVAE